jgi:FKBP-type peptidyl-prolyl cis-trans isomerase FkpA
MNITLIPVRPMKRFLIAVGLLSMSACLDVAGPTVSDPAKETFAASLGVNIAQMQKTASGTYYKDLTVGTGTQLSAPTVTTQVRVDYTGWLVNGTMFDSGVDTKFPLGGVIYGFVDGIVNMKIGGERLIVIPSDLGYGNTTQTGGTATIPANSTLVFKVKLKAIE